MVDEFIDAWQFAQRRKSAALTQNEAATLKGVTRVRISQIDLADTDAT